MSFPCLLSRGDLKTASPGRVGIPYMILSPDHLLPHFTPFSLTYLRQLMLKPIHHIPHRTHRRTHQTTILERLDWPASDSQLLTETHRSQETVISKSDQSVPGQTYYMGADAFAVEITNRRSVCQRIRFDHRSSRVARHHHHRVLPASTR
jgi:hypothetical protein